MYVEIARSDLLELLSERDALSKQVTELQTRMSEMVERSLPRRVRTFHEKFGHPVRHVPTVPSDDEMRFRMRLMLEEFRELFDAILIDGAPGIAFDTLSFHISHAGMGVDLPELADAMEDLDYVVEGTRAVCGINGGPIADEVHRANMSKGANGPNGKPTKPVDWRPPDVAGELRRQGWPGPGSKP